MRFVALIAAERLLPAFVALFAIAGCSGDDGSMAASPAANTEAIPVGTGFDFYVLSLSWSPSWCKANDPQGKTDQCETGGRRRGLVVHGLWPQYERDYPENCPSQAPRRVPEALGRQYLDLIPSMGLIGHQWRKHGTCSGLGQADYFAVTRMARERLTIPPDLLSTGQSRNLSVSSIESAFVKKNPGMTQQMIAVTCEGRLLDEVRICFDKELNFRTCPGVDSRACRRSAVVLPSAQ
ncbi:ribonuclease T(2) [Sinorhizobium alkalisoli]|uniref:Ribonuclease T(2) n=2 Tax=Sinorhizobium alkalisoli TaxID=1752398 RepID=A0A1E3V6N9_9HYPH|nr:ribonuclease T(2) [Sinorhizobium alkalisoli]ODR89230.1 ribonuclease T(2) [Sinorhizobium alkalisoli]QFI65683.1 Ribonuclease T2 family protein [Sinorhizobium alkalisoli]